MTVLAEDPVYSVAYAEPGVQVERARRGDLILTHGTEPLHAFVRWGQRLRLFLARVGTAEFRRQVCHYDHVAVYVGPFGLGAPECVVEALPGPGGVRISPFAGFDGREYHRVDLTGPCDWPTCPARDGGYAGDRDRDQAVDYVLSSVGLRYGLVFHYLGMAVTTLSGGCLTFSGTQSEICSSLAAQEACRAGHVFDRPPAATMPADLARHFGVVPERSRL